MVSPDSNRSWLTLAILSGTCAAVNGAFAKLTTTTLTASWARAIASTIHFEGQQRLVEYVVRTAFFILNLVFNGIMWGLFTHALTLSPSAIRVNVINTASNFLITAVLGSGLFGERLPPLWFAGAAMLVAGSVMIGAREELRKEDVVQVVDVSAREDKTIKLPSVQRKSNNATECDYDRRSESTRKRTVRRSENLK